MSSDYEQMRESNIKEFRELFKKQFGEYPGKTTASSVAAEFHSTSVIDEPQNRKRTYHKTLVMSPQRRSARLQGHRPPTSFLESDDDEDYNPDRKTISTKLKRIKRSVTPRISLKREILPPEAVNDDDLEKICYRSAGKVYDSKHGSTCHQCRQKTVDVKSICRNKNCVGIRGQFCGFCLHNRYGEDVATTLKDPDWSCPPCRNICNCSICRRRLGKLPTGILVPEAQSRGFSNVKDFLETVDEDKLINEDEDELLDGDEDKLINGDGDKLINGDGDKLINGDESKLIKEDEESAEPEL
ncbi:cell division cycle-associated 7-like protein [Halyomorpha halys]|uniref:cell division cycle-associated 7-like protein n=1 Tax=Halyomorpha halys TaxID=286706 RepID=UPI0006D4D4F2|nr:cell division cycle-associated 7-like protein [Halyomorpha halys]